MPGFPQINQLSNRLMNFSLDRKWMKFGVKFQSFGMKQTMGQSHRSQEPPVSSTQTGIYPQMLLPYKELFVTGP